MINTKKFLRKSKCFYTLILVDIVSKFIFYKNLSSKNSADIVSAFRILLTKIRKMKNPQLKGIKSNDFITFIRQVSSIILATNKLTLIR